MGGGVLDRRDVLDLIHGRGRMAIDPTIPGRSMSCFFTDQAGIPRAKREASCGGGRVA